MTPNIYLGGILDVGELGATAFLALSTKPVRDKEQPLSIEDVLVK